MLRSLTVELWHYNTTGEEASLSSPEARLPCPVREWWAAIQARVELISQRVSICSVETQPFSLNAAFSPNGSRSEGDQLGLYNHCSPSKQPVI